MVEISDSVRNFIAFWIFGLCNNFAYVIMLSAAEDIMDQQGGSHSHNSTADDPPCMDEITSRKCHSSSIGAVLLADILPSLVAKIALPFCMHRLPHGVRHTIVCVLQASSYLIVAFSNSVPLSLFGVVCAALGSGMGENAYLALTAHYTGNAISAWSSGTGGAGIFGSLAYAGLTEQHFLGLSPRTTLLVMLVVPVLFYLTNYTILVQVPTVYKAKLRRPKTWIVPAISKSDAISSTTDDKNTISKPAWTSSDESIAGKEEEVQDQTVSSNIAALSTLQRMKLVIPLLKYMIPVALVYYAEYLINQGLTQFMVFECSKGFNISPKSQYRWYQVLYQLGVFISRSSVNVIELPFWGLLVLPVLQFGNTIFFTFEALFYFIPHIWVTFVVILFEGFFGGASYVNTFHRIHKDADPRYREFSLAVASLADAVGIVLAGLSTIPIHNFICDLNSTK